jgi:hypothetical protein
VEILQQPNFIKRFLKKEEHVFIMFTASVAQGYDLVNELRASDISAENYYWVQ